MKALLPPSLRPGDLVAVAAPAGAVDRKRLLPSVDSLAARGYQVTYRDDIFAREGYLAGDDRRRTAELNSYLRSREVKAIFFARGGYGTSRIIDRLDLASLGRHPKIVAGYSDTTALLLAIKAEVGLATFHGPFVTDVPTDLDRLLRTVSGAIEPLSFSRLRPLRSGRARAPVTGGNLSLLAHSVGTPFEIDTDRRILFVEEVNEAPYRVDRMVRQLLIAGKFAKLRGLIIGRFSGISRSERKKCEEILLEASGRRTPVAASFPAGHGQGNRAFPFGVTATLDTSARSLVFSPFLGD